MAHDPHSAGCNCPRCIREHGIRLAPDSASPSDQARNVLKIEPPVAPETDPHPFYDMRSYMAGYREGFKRGMEQALGLRPPLETPPSAEPAAYEPPQVRYIGNIDDLIAKTLTPKP
jgi:hypothetical protein